MTLHIEAARQLFARRWPSFSIEEIFSPDQIDLITTKAVFPYSFKALDTLEKFRQELDIPLRVNRPSSQLLRRGARSTKENFEIQKVTKHNDGWSYSFHLWCAFDVDSPALGPLSIYNKAIESGLWSGIGIYDTWVHLDTRDLIYGVPIRWDLRTRK